MGNIPAAMTEAECIKFIADTVPNLPPPYKVVLRDGGKGTQFGIASWRFRNSRMAFKDLHWIWPNGKHVVLQWLDPS